MKVRIKMWGEYRFGIYNCKVGRDPQVVGKFVLWLLRHFNLDFLFLQEATQYKRVLDRVPGYQNFQYDEGVDTTELAILVKDRIYARRPVFRRMKKRWWGAKNRRWRAPRILLSIRAGKLRLTGLHRVAYQKHQVNREANRELDAALIGHLQQHSSARNLVVADWNDRISSPELERIIEAIDALPPIPDVNDIDYGITTGRCRITELREIDEDGGSDHKPKIGTVRWWRRGWRGKR